MKKVKLKPTDEERAMFPWVNEAGWEAWAEWTKKALERAEKMEGQGVKPQRSKPNPYLPFPAWPYQMDPPTLTEEEAFQRVGGDKHRAWIAIGQIREVLERELPNASVSALYDPRAMAEIQSMAVALFSSLLWMLKRDLPAARHPSLLQLFSEIAVSSTQHLEAWSEHCAPQISKVAEKFSEWPVMTRRGSRDHAAAKQAMLAKLKVGEMSDESSIGRGPAPNAEFTTLAAKGVAFLKQSKEHTGKLPPFSRANARTWAKALREVVEQENGPLHEYPGIAEHTQISAAEKIYDKRSKALDLLAQAIRSFAAPARPLKSAPPSKSTKGKR